ncbi:type II and III secretion system protein family protein [Starkeya sp. ORNL1]|uniref:type II and III secretion system protein family protein n=1 Tax=Starkeya sp. ORNL1 TaxID=2709380 RepID=UPI001462C171|nr:type II and III secretion system protein family protein [Starkeya sp. ORNL1]QJP15262.1 type II and III secretion system protein family protein [Starkeya sp. ORNL1]
MRLRSRKDRALGAWRRSAFIGLLAISACAGIVPPVHAADPAYGDYAGTPGRSKVLPIGIGKSVVIDLPREIKDVLVANPAIANAVVRSARRAYLIGVAPGQTSIVFFDAEGRQIVGYDVEVGRDGTGMKAALAKIIPTASVSVDVVNDSVVLSGQVANAGEAQTIVDAAAKLVGDPNKVVNGLTIRDKEQVLLKVSVAEVNRTVIKQLGVDWNAENLNIGGMVFTAATGFPFPVNGDLGSVIGGDRVKNITVPDYGGDAGKMLNARDSIGATVKALEQTGIFRTLAEPTLTAISGESAEFLAGGEFPYTVCSAADGGYTCSTEFKPFGVNLKFTPVVLSSGRISLRVSTEVSEIDPTISPTRVITNGTTTISNSTPALAVRRATSTIELPSGGSMAMAGMIQNKTRQTVSGLPGLLSLPVLGTLFKSRDYQRGETELVILVTPYLAKPVATSQLARPDDGFADPSDPSTIFLSRLNRIYGVPGTTADPRRFEGRYGFIID